MNTFTIEKPRIPVTAWLMGAVILIGLAALGIAAYHAFIQVSPWYQALFSSLLIEVSAIVEAIALIRGKNWIAAAGLIVSLAVSGTYNYIQAETAGAASGLSNAWQLFTLAVGPLSALTFLSMTLGRELRAHEEKVSQWQVQRQAWVDRLADERKKEQERQDQQRLQEEERVRKLQEEQQKRRQELELERIRQENQLKLEQERLRLQFQKDTELAKYRAELKAESRKDPSAETISYRKVTGDWRSVPDEDKRLIAEMDTNQIMQTYGVSDRTARNWKANAAKNGFHKEQTNAQG